MIVSLFPSLFLHNKFYWIYNASSLQNDIIRLKVYPRKCQYAFIPVQLHEIALAYLMHISTASLSGPLQLPGPDMYTIDKCTSCQSKGSNNGPQAKIQPQPFIFGPWSVPKCTETQEMMGIWPLGNCRWNLTGPPRPARKYNWEP